MSAPGLLASRRVRDFVSLTKPRVVLMIVVTTAVAYHLGSAARPDWMQLWHTLAGTALAAGGTLALNQFLELLDEQAPNSPLIGGMASSARQPGENALVRNDQVLTDGFVGVSLSGAIDVESVVSQGARPIGRPPFPHGRKSNRSPTISSDTCQSRSAASGSTAWAS